MKNEWRVCDMDGTLLDSRRQLSAENIQAIKQLLLMLSAGDW